MSQLNDEHNETLKLNLNMQSKGNPKMLVRSNEPDEGRLPAQAQVLAFGRLLEVNTRHSQTLKVSRRPCRSAVCFCGVADGNGAE